MLPLWGDCHSRAAPPKLTRSQYRPGCCQRWTSGSLRGWSWRWARVVGNWSCSRSQLHVGARFPQWFLKIRSFMMQLLGQNFKLTKSIITTVLMSFNIEHGKVELDSLARIHADGPATVRIVWVSARVAGWHDGATCLTGYSFPTHRPARVPGQMEPMIGNAVVRPELQGHGVPGKNIYFNSPSSTLLCTWMIWYCHYCQAVRCHNISQWTCPDRWDRQLSPANHICTWSCPTPGWTGWRWCWPPSPPPRWWCSRRTASGHTQYHRQLGSQYILLEHCSYLHMIQPVRERNLSTLH